MHTTRLSNTTGILVLPSMLVLAAVLRLWGLGDDGYGTEYYAAAVRSMLGNFHNFFFNAFDPAGTLTVDKPPLALWLQVLSAHLLGYSAFSLMLPQAIEGTACVWLTWLVVRRDFGGAAANLAALFLALTPISVAVDRTNNTDSLLVLTLLIAAWLLPRAGERAAPQRLVAAMAMVGVAFNVKMLAAFGVLPGFAAAYLFAAHGPRLRRVGHLAIGGVALAVVSVSWIGAVAMTPADARPYVDSSPSNSIFELVIDHNALQRFIPRAWREPAFMPPQTTRPPTRPRGPAPLRNPPPGLARLADPQLASQAVWLLPLALAGAAAMILRRRIEAAGIWVGWAMAYGAVFSFAGGLFSAYYLVLLGPPLAALAGVGVVALGRQWSGETAWRWSLPAVLAASLGWQMYVMYPQAATATSELVLLAGLIGVLLAFAALRVSWQRQPGVMPALALAMGVGALLVAPSAWAIGTVRAGGGRPMARLVPPGIRAGNRWAGAENVEIQALLPFLEQNRNGARFLAATATARLAAPLIIATDEPVLAFGGFQGTMPVADAAALAHLADTGALRFVLLAHENGRGPRAAAETDTVRWVRDHGKPVDIAGERRVEVYDLQNDGG